MKTKKQIGTNTLKNFMYVVLVLIGLTLVFLSILGRQTQINLSKAYLKDIPMYKSALDSMQKVIQNQDSLKVLLTTQKDRITQLEDQKKQLQDEVYRLQPLELEVYNLRHNKKTN